LCNNFNGAEKISESTDSGVITIRAKQCRHSTIFKYVIVRIFFVVIGLQIPFIVYTRNLEAAEWYVPDNIGVRTFLGKTQWTSFGPDTDDDYTWINASFFASKEAFSWLDIIAGLGPGYLKTDNHGSTATVELRLLGQAHYGFLYFDLGGGVAYLFDRGNLPDLADSELYGIISAGLGIEIFHFEGAHHNIFCKAGYRIEHLSSPFHDSNDGDSGLNIGALELTLGWSF
jgi:hypothetical protein